ncbi:hypothetical protein GCM10011415_02380 [Salipiger pallidus]|uniref:Uncharacterized protein n=1 Tax=Salipiger pallidus TaxID=1775170 RepID=A0A8J3EEU8_9RHOB|nr:hypothetical protein GCM10011415_02380 [Salipiger pallidus]
MDPFRDFVADILLRSLDMASALTCSKLMINDSFVRAEGTGRLERAARYTNGRLKEAALQR